MRSATGSRVQIVLPVPLAVPVLVALRVCVCVRACSCCLGHENINHQSRYPFPSPLPSPVCSHRGCADRRILSPHPFVDSDVRCVICISTQSDPVAYPEIWTAIPFYIFPFSFFLSLFLFSFPLEVRISATGSGGAP